MSELIVVRAPNWLGDTVMAQPALAALRTACPDSRILVVGPWASLLAGQGVADALLEHPRGWRQRRALARAIAAERPDVAVILPNSFRAALAAVRWRARRRVGFDTDARGPLLTDLVPRPTPRLHQVDEYRRIVAALGAVDGPRFPVWRRTADEAAEAEVSALWSGAGLAPGSHPVGLHVGAAGGPSKQWAPSAFGALAATLARRGIVPLVLGAASDAVAAAEVETAAGRPLPSLVGRDRPALLPAVLARLGALVSGDTGVAHLAAALGTPTVTLFGPTDPALTGPRAPGATVLVGSAPCAPCFLAACPIEHLCLRAIAPEEVAATVQRAVSP